MVDDFYLQFLRTVNGINGCIEKYFCDDVLKGEMCYFM